LELKRKPFIKYLRIKSVSYLFYCQGMKICHPFLSS
jgi:hypothetical protein